MSPLHRLVFTRLAPLVFVLLGLFALYKGGRDLQWAQASPNWPTVTGIVEHSQVAESVDKGKKSYYADVVYRYEVQGTAHQAKQIAFGDYRSSDPAPYQEIISRYPVGANVKIYYQPDVPEVAVLEPGVSRQAYIIPGFGIALSLIGIVGAIVLPRWTQRG
jgi:hypothetical protein